MVLSKTRLADLQTTISERESESGSERPREREMKRRTPLYFDPRDLCDQIHSTGIIPLRWASTRPLSWLKMPVIYETPENIGYRRRIRRLPTRRWAQTRHSRIEHSVDLEIRASCGMMTTARATVWAAHFSWTNQSSDRSFSATGSTCLWLTIFDEVMVCSRPCRWSTPGTYLLESFDQPSLLENQSSVRDTTGRPPRASAPATSGARDDDQDERVAPELDWAPDSAQTRDKMRAYRTKMCTSIQRHETIGSEDALSYTRRPAWSTTARPKKRIIEWTRTGRDNCCTVRSFVFLLFHWPTFWTTLWR